MTTFRTLFVLASALVLIPSTLMAESPNHYPKAFIWGAALSAHQAEGAFGGGENGDWYAYEHQTGGVSPIANQANADVATDFWHRYDEDFQIASDLGLNSLRTSVAWEKIEPQLGVFNEEAMNHYHEIFAKMKSHGIKPMIALHHFTHPIWFMQAGGWTSKSAPALFLNYARYVVEHLQDVCDLWITFNEPNVLATIGYGAGVFPPNHSSIEEVFQSSYEMARAHRMVAAMIHEIQPPTKDARDPDGSLRGVGIAENVTLLEPANPWNLIDDIAASWASESYNWLFPKTVLSGVLDVNIPGTPLPFIVKALPAQDLKPWKNPGKPFDWLGLNYYTCSQIAFHWSSPHFVQQYASGMVLGDNGWAVCPRGFETVIRKAEQTFGRSVPLVITENGMADGKDTRRAAFIDEHLKRLDSAVYGTKQEAPMDIRGYYHWSLTDNFEWREGYSKKFGLVEVQYQQGGKRVPRPSATAYQNQIRSRR
jgi:beta-glucosidase